MSWRRLTTFVDGMPLERVAAFSPSARGAGLNKAEVDEFLDVAAAALSSYPNFSAQGWQRWIVAVALASVES